MQMVGLEVNHSSVLKTKTPQLFAESEGGDGCLVCFEVFAFEILQQAFATTDHLDQSATSHVVVLVGLQVLGNLLDANRQNRNLSLWRPNVGFVRLRQSECLGFVVCCNHQEVLYQS